MNDEEGLDAYQRKLRELSSAYLTRTAAGFEEVGVHLEQARHGQSAALHAIILIVHRASGSGGMLGFPQISNLASRLEVQLRNACDAPLSTAEWHDIERQLRVLQAAISAEQQARNATQSACGITPAG